MRLVRNLPCAANCHAHDARQPFLKIGVLVLMAWLLAGGTARAAPPAVRPGLPPEGLALREGWRWHPGDHPAWAQPTFDDRTWETVDPAQALVRLPALRAAGRGWFRLRLPASAGLHSGSFVLEIEQAGYSDVFFNGKPCPSLGEIPVQNGTTERYLVEATGNPASGGVLCLRYTTPPRLALVNPLHRPVARVVLRPAEAGRRDFDRLYRFEFFSASLRFGVFFILCLLHLVFFALMRSQPANLFFGLFALCHLLRGALTLLWLNGSFGLEDERIEFFDVLLAQSGQTLFLAATYALFRRRFDGWFWGLVGLTAVAVALLPVVASSRTVLVLVTNLLMALLAIRVSVGAVRHRMPDAGVLFVGTGAYFLVRLFFSLSNWLDAGNYAATSGAFLLGTLSLSLCVSVLLARLLPRTNWQLQERLAEVERLSQQNLAQEQEKQHLLETQNERLEAQVVARTTELQQSLDHLRATQAQLIQREKMASLGELTAGIAHEIQNPLNFVNNFSEVAVELLDEVRQEQKKEGEQDGALVDDLLGDVRQNLEKIAHHGKRADAIVKGMLQHSRTSTGQKEPTDLNALADECLRLTYHGLHGKDKELHAKLVTDFDASLGLVNVVPQDMSRVLLNLFSNAFYAVLEKQKNLNQNLLGLQDLTGLAGLAPYQPTISVSTTRQNGWVEIRISDNGTGIPEAVVPKIFQPFFTTKPTGQGTGLGLSLSYDIVTKGHGGTLDVETAVGVGTTFTVRLPVPKPAPAG